MASKVKEAQERQRAAEQFLKTSWMKWNPDYDSAADEYTKAGQFYKISKDMKSAKECFLKAADCQKKIGSFFYAAKSLENAILAAKDTCSPEEIYKYTKESSSLYQQSGYGDAGARVLDKGGNIVLNSHPEMALSLYQSAVDATMAAGCQHNASEYISKASRLLVKLGRYDGAVESICQEITHHLEQKTHGPITRLTVALVLVHLARGDHVAAEKHYREYSAICEVEEVDVMERILAAYNDEDRDAAVAALRAPFIRSMDVEYSILAQNVPLPEVIEAIPNKSTGINNFTSQENAEGYTTTSATVPHPNVNEEDGDELC